MKQDIHITCKNSFAMNPTDINVPITIDGVPVGVITEVSDDFVHGMIWGAYAGKLYDSGKACSVEICHSK